MSDCVTVHSCSGCGHRASPDCYVCRGVPGRVLPGENLFLPLGLKFVRKYMRRAKHIADENRACYARQIGVVLIDPVRNKPLGDGYNGPPTKTPHCDTQEYLREAVWPKVTLEDKQGLMGHLSPIACGTDEGMREAFVGKYACRGICPRRILGAKSGTRLEICSCEHAERNAIANAGCDLLGAWMFCWCPVPCWDCGKAIIQNRIKKVFCVTDPTYGEAYDLERTMFLFRHAGVEVFIAGPDYYLKD